MQPCGIASGASWPGSDLYPDIAQSNYLPSTNLAGLAEFDVAIDGDCAAGDNGFAAAAAIARAGKFQQLVERNVIAVQDKADQRHG